MGKEGTGMASVFDSLVDLPKRFTLSNIQAWRPEAERMTLDDPLTGVCMDLRWNILDGVVTGERECRALHQAHVAEHYFGNVILLLAFILDDLEEYREGKKRAWPKRLRLPLDLDKMLTDTRAMMDALYCLALLYQPDADRVLGKKRHSFGKFSDWYEAKSPGTFAAPLGLLVEVMHWAQDIRTLRDGYVHRGHESLVFYGDTELYLDPSAHRPPPRQRVLPDLFYEPSNPNNLLLVEKFLAFVVAPTLAVRRAIGDCLHATVQALPGWRHQGIGMPYKEGPGIFRLHQWLLRNTDVLDPAVFTQRHFS
jgi:hypothetical protein